VWVIGKEGERPIPASAVFALTGYHPDFDFLRQQGIAVDPETHKPAHNPETLETNVPGIYLAGVVIGGRNTGEIFIENGRFHGKQIIAALMGK
jgi:thioredoxin reductase (NADPH)